MAEVSNIAFSDGESYEVADASARESVTDLETRVADIEAIINYGGGAVVLKNEPSDVVGALWYE